MAGKLFVLIRFRRHEWGAAKSRKYCRLIRLIAEVDEKAVRKRHAQGWVDEVNEDLDLLVRRVKEAKINGK